MMIPEFDNKGNLPLGIHLCSMQEFIEHFCKSDIRRKFLTPIYDIFDFAKGSQVAYIFIGGSFITNKEKPNDFDCVIVFTEDRQIPAQIQTLAIEGIKFDILYASLESTYLVDYYIKLFQSGRFGKESKGVIQIDLYQEEKSWEIQHNPSIQEFEIIKKLYTDRHIIDLNQKSGLLVSVHGLLSRAEWMQEISPIASSQGWIYAPYVYDTNKPDLLINPIKRKTVVNEFREWLFDIAKRYGVDTVSIIGHSFGTYIIASYLDGFELREKTPVKFDSIILTGSILNCAYDWEKFKGLSVGKVYNMIAPKDEFVCFMPESKLKRFIGMSDSFGKAGVDGFIQDLPMVVQSRNEIFTHTNTIKRDIIETKWMPFINAYKNSLQADTIELMLKGSKTVTVENR